MKSYSINQKVNEGEKNIRRAKCFNCDCILEKGEGYRVFIPSKGIRVVCSQHYSNNGLLGYHGNARNNNSIIGTEKSTPLASTTIGVEIECKKSMDDSSFTTLRSLVENSFMCRMESDCTVSGEMPTAIVQGLGKFSKTLQTIELHNMLPIVNNEACGAHIHVECNNIAYIRRYYHSIFLPLATYIYNMGASRRIELFGSDFRYYARMIDEHSDPLNHSNIFNTQHEHTLEFRLPRITSYKQYMKLLKFWRECGCYINHYFFNENDNSAMRRVYARECGKALVDIAKKYFE